MQKSCNFKPLVVTEICVSLHSEALHNHVYFILPKQLIIVSEYNQRQENKKVYIKKVMFQTTTYLVNILTLGVLSCLFRVAIRC